MRPDPSPKQPQEFRTLHTCMQSIALSIITTASASDPSPKPPQEFRTLKLTCSHSLFQSHATTVNPHLNSYQLQEFCTYRHTCNQLLYQSQKRVPIPIPTNLKNVNFKNKYHFCFQMQSHEFHESEGITHQCFSYLHGMPCQVADGNCGSSSWLTYKCYQNHAACITPKPYCMQNCPGLWQIQNSMVQLEPLQGPSQCHAQKAN